MKFENPRIHTLLEKAQQILDVLKSEYPKNDDKNFGLHMDVQVSLMSEFNDLMNEAQRLVKIEKDQKKP